MCFQAFLSFLGYGWNVAKPNGALSGGTPFDYRLTILRLPMNGFWFHSNVVRKITLYVCK